MTRSFNRRELLITASMAGFSSRVASAAIGATAVEIEALFKRRWDYIIVGGGSAGCVLARRLSENPASTILLLEAGGVVSDPAVSTPGAWPGLAGGPYDWKYASIPQAGLGGRSVPEPRGKGLGGSTLINALGFQRGARQAYDRWATEAGPNWNYDALLPYFRRLETASGGATAYRGGDGPLHVLQVGGVADQNPLSTAIANAGVSKGHAFNPDWNGERADGTIWTQLTIRDGKRDTAATAFLDPVRERKNLGVATGAQVMRLKFNRQHCRGVEVFANGRVYTVSAARETILSAGAFDSPRLLLASGIGDAETLKRVSVPTIQHLPGVGQNLHDHPLVPGLLYRARRPIPMSHYNHSETMVIAQSAQSPGWADLQLMGISAPFLSPELGQAPPDSFSIVPGLLYPRSRGSMTITSAEPNAPIMIDPAYLRDAKDVEALVDSIEISREIASAPTLREWIAEELFPGPAMTNRADVATHIRRVVSPFFHPVSTCKMGVDGDPGAVVDAACKVRGVSGLRVVDASVFPSIPQAMTNAAVMAVAERASDLIRGLSPA